MTIPVSSNSRRNFLQTTFQASLLTGVAGLSAGTVLNAMEGEAAERPAPLGRIQPGDIVLFQGDSITDARRSRPDAGTPNKQPGLGQGYAWMAASALLTSPGGDQLTIYNRGISGNKVPQLAERWQADCLDLKPNVLSILIGVNDIWHRLSGRSEGTAETYARDYRALLQRTKDALPEVRLILCEPFVLRCGAVNDDWFPEFDDYRAVARTLAEDFQAAFVPFHSLFEAAVQYAPPEHWAADGVHPTPHGASLMAAHWIRAAYSA